MGKVTMATICDEPPAAAPGTDRVLSVDVLRGFDMFWIVGGGGLAVGLNKISDNRLTGFLATQLEHVKWEGFRFYDLIFPLFVFLVGVSIVFSVGKLVKQGNMTAVYGRIFRRFLLLFALGLFYYGGISDGIHEMRVMGVLQRLALCYLFASLLFCHLNLYGLAIITAVLLIGYWALFTFVPVPGLDRTSFDNTLNWAFYIDQNFLPFRKNDGTWDPEGILSTIPAVASCLLGVMAGYTMKSQALSPARRVAILIGGGILLVVAGYLWGLQFPIIKKIWTSSFALVAGGYSAILLGVFYFIVDICGLQLWARPFIWIGSNALAIYMARNIIRFGDLAERIVGGEIQEKCGSYGTLLVVIVGLGLTLWLARFLYRKGIFIRV